MTLSTESRSSEVGAPTSLLVSSKRVIYHIFKWVSIVAVVTIFVSLLLGVVVRYIFSTNLGWVAEVPNLVFPWLTMCAIVATAARNEHIGVELVVEKLPRLPKKLVVLAVNLIAMIAFSFMAVNADWYVLGLLVSRRWFYGVSCYFVHQHRNGAHRGRSIL